VLCLPFGPSPSLGRPETRKAQKTAPGAHVGRPRALGLWRCRLHNGAGSSEELDVAENAANLGQASRHAHARTAGRALSLDGDDRLPSSTRW
jgi:hypothetical protein